MTTLYRDPRQDYLLIHSTVDQATLARWKQQIEDYMERSEKENEKGFWNQLQHYMDTYFDSSFAEPYTLYHTVTSADLLSMFPPDKKPIGSYMVSYRRWQLDEEHPSTEKKAPFSLTNCLPGDGRFSAENHRMNYAYDRNYDWRYREYTALFCIRCDEGVTGGTLLFYPDYDEESSIGSTLSQLITQCSLPRREMEVPFVPGTMILLSGNTWYTMDALRGKGTYLLMIVDFFTESAD